MYYSAVHVSSLKCSSSGGYSCIHAAYGTVTVRGGLSVHSLSENCVLFSCTCFEPQVLIFRRIQLYTCSIWYCHCSWWPVGTQLERKFTVGGKVDSRADVSSEMAVSSCSGSCTVLILTLFLCGASIVSRL